MVLAALPNMFPMRGHVVCEPKNWAHYAEFSAPVIMEVTRIF